MQNKATGEERLLLVILYLRTHRGFMHLWRLGKCGDGAQGLVWRIVDTRQYIHALLPPDYILTYTVAPRGNSYIPRCRKTSSPPSSRGILD